VPLRDKVILVVDDELHYREIMKGWFEKEGARVLTAENGAVALELLQKSDCNAVVTDIRMPVMDGAELVRRIKATGKYTPTAVSVSGFSDLAPREAYDLGIEAQLSKPVERKVLVSALRRTMADREQLWAGPLRETTLPPLKIEFGDLSTAFEKRLIAFGRGGFCVTTAASFPEDASIGFELSFTGEGRIVAGRGIVRWSDPKEKLVGIEIDCILGPSRAWIAAQSRLNQTLSFIPRSV
jgi:CheY-like chemotaxis protein